jgi:hypothetical protein
MFSLSTSQLNFFRALQKRFQPIGEGTVVLLPDVDFEEKNKTFLC